MNGLGIELISVFGMSPPAFVHLAADLGCQYISTVAETLPINPEGYAPWSMRTDPSVRRDLQNALRDRGLYISLGEGFLIMPGVEAKSYERDLDMMCELGAKRISMLGFDPDLARVFDQFAILAEMAAGVGMPTATEFAPCFSVRDLPTALAARRHVGRKDFRIVLDTMHLIRSGGCAADVAAVDPDAIAYVQLCDVPLVPKILDYMEEASKERLAPGDGELPLREILEALPSHLEISVETPMLAEAEAGKGPEQRLRPVVAKARALLAELQQPVA